MEQILSEAPGNKRIEGRKIRVGTFNVHSWRDANLVSNGRRVLNNLQSQNIDIACMQEVSHPDFVSFEVAGREHLETRQSVLETIVKEMSLSDFMYGPAIASFGNAIVSRFPIKRREKCKLHTQSGSLHFFIRFLLQKETRSIVCTVVEIENVGEIGIYCTHLDQIKEETRLKQLEQIFEFLEQKGLDKIPHLIVGDFNSLGHAEDYPKKQWDLLIYRRKNNMWELPKDQVISTMEGKGYVDTWKKAGGSPSAASCWAETRIDYIFASSDFSGIPIHCNVVNNNASDHNLVMVEFQFPEKLERM